MWRKIEPKIVSVERKGQISCMRRDSGRNEGVRRCLLGVRNVGECLWLPLAMSRGDMGVSGDVYGCLGGVRGSWKVLGDLRGVSGSP